MLTKTDIAAIRRADTLCVHLGGRNPSGLVRLIKRKPYNAKPFESDQEYRIESAIVRMETAIGKAAIESGRAECFGYVDIFHSQGSPASGILKTLREGDEVQFSFYPDAQSNQYVTNAGLHADALWMHVTRNGKRQTWELDVSICPENSARMCRSVPSRQNVEA